MQYNIYIYTVYTYVWPTTIGTSERVKNPSRKLETDIGHQQLLPTASEIQSETMG